MLKMVVVDIDDNDKAGVHVSESLVAVTETTNANATAEYTMKLTSRPWGNVTIDVSTASKVLATYGYKGPHYQLVIEPADKLVFGPLTWNISQRVIVRAQDDDFDED